MVNALVHISNISDRAAIALIVNREADDKKMGITFNNVAKSEMGAQFDLSTSYPIFNEEMRCSSYFIKEPEEWSVYYIACDQRFIDSICTLPPVKLPTDEEESFLDLVLYRVKDGSVEKSESVVFGDHKPAFRINGLNAH